jgi:hypothetical protein
MSHVKNKHKDVVLPTDYEVAWNIGLPSVPKESLCNEAS